MILRSIELSGWRCFLEKVSVGPFSERLNVIYGPNGTGKSSLFEALRRSLMDRFDVSGQEISEVRPWGRALSPKITVAFHHGGEEYRVHKQFLDGGFSTLMRKENGDFRPLAEGRGADDTIRELLSRSSPGRGLSQSKHWGIAQVLWAPQGELRIGEVSEDLIENIHKTLGLQISERTGGLVEEKIKDRYLQFFSPQGRAKTGKGAPRLVALNDNLAQAREKRSEASVALRKAEDASRKVENLELQLKQSTLEAEELEKSILKARAAVESYRALAAAESVKRSDHDRIAAQYAELNARIKAIHEVEKELEDLGSAVAKTEAELPLIQSDSEKKAKLVQEAGERLEASRKDAEAISIAEKDAEDAREYLSCFQKITEQRERIKQIEAAEGAVAELTEERARFVAPETKTIKSLRKLFHDRDEAKKGMDFTQLRLELTPEANGRLEVVKGEDPGCVELTAGYPALVRGTPEISAVIEGVARMVISGPPGDFGMYQKAYREKQDKILEITRPFGSPDLDSLEDLYDKACQLDQKIAQAQKRLEGFCGADDKDSLVSALARYEAVALNLETAHPDWQKAHPNPEAMKRRALDLKHKYDAVIRESERRWQAATTADVKAKEHLEGVLREFGSKKQNIRKAELRLADAVSDGATKEERAKTLQQFLLDRDASGEALKDIQNKLRGLGSNPEESLKKIEMSLEATQTEAQQLRDAERTASGNLEILIALGPYSALAVAEEEIVRLEEKIRQDQLEMDSVKLLYDTLAECRSAVLSAYAQPVEDEASRLMRRIAGSGIGKIGIGNQLVPSGVIPGAAAEVVAVENLSGGEQEQLYFSTRLALAKVLAREERQMVVLDDVLAATDTPRLARILGILDEASENLQILILTCHPERYRALADASFFDLEALVRGEP